MKGVQMSDKRHSNSGRSNRGNRKFNSSRAGKTADERGIDQDLNNAEHAIKRRDRSKTSFCGTNDPKWYGLNPQLLNDAGSLSFNWPMGVGMPDVEAPNYTARYSVPGVMAMYYLPTPGPSDSETSAINVAKNRLFSFVRHANSGAKNYDPVDLMMYVWAIKSACETYLQCVRAYGVANVYAQTNRYLPGALISAMGFRNSDVRTNLANFRYALGVYAAKLNSVVVPATFSIFARSSWLCSNVFKDAVTVKSQSFIMRPTHYYTFVEKTTTGLGYLKAAPYPEDGTTDTWLNILETQLAAIIASEDCGIMGGDIAKAYGAGGLLSVPAPAENYIVVPMYDEEALVQINNARMFSDWDGSSGGANALVFDAASLDMTQDSNGCLLFKPFDKGHSQASMDSYMTLLNLKSLLTLRTDSPTPADVMVATRFKFGGVIPAGTSDTDKLKLAPIVYGTEIPTHGKIWTYQTGETPSEWILTNYNVHGFLVYNAADRIVQQMDLASKFDWMPAINFRSPLGTPSNTKLMGIYLDVDNYVPIGATELEKLHNTAILSMFNVPALAGDFSRG